MNPLTAAYLVCQAQANATADGERNTYQGYYNNCIDPNYGYKSSQSTTLGYCYYEVDNGICPADDSSCTSISACNQMYLGYGGVCNTVLQTELIFAENDRKRLLDVCTNNLSQQGSVCPGMGACLTSGDCQGAYFDAGVDHGPNCVGGVCVGDGGGQCGDDVIAEMTAAGQMKVAWPCLGGSECGGGDEASILVDLGGAGYLLTDTTSGVSFDALADGKVRQLAWSAKGAELGFLVLDRNRNDSGPGFFASAYSQPIPSRQGTGSAAAPAVGTRLTGTPTPTQATGSEMIGFAALALYDQPDNGGNGDGQIDANDAVYSQLRIWVDKSHDGISQGDEVFTLAELGITSISLDYEAAPWTDAFGNRFGSRTQFVRNATAQWAVDVRLAAAN